MWKVYESYLETPHVVFVQEEEQLLLTAHASQVWGGALPELERCSNSTSE